jgi:hypothetical protein
LEQNAIDPALPEPPPAEEPPPPDVALLPFEPPAAFEDEESDPVDWPPLETLPFSLVPPEPLVPPDEPELSPPDLQPDERSTNANVAATACEPKRQKSDLIMSTSWQEE